jgi:hypothetical protein
MAIDDRNKYPLQTPPSFADPKLARQMVSTENPDGTGAPYPRSGPTTAPVGGFSGAACGGDMVSNRTAAGFARQAEISRSKANLGPRKSSSPPGDEN